MTWVPFDFSQSLVALTRASGKSLECLISIYSRCASSAEHDSQSAQIIPAALDCRAHFWGTIPPHAFPCTEAVLNLADSMIQQDEHLRAALWSNCLLALLAGTSLGSLLPLSCLGQVALRSIPVSSKRLFETHADTFTDWCPSARITAAMAALKAGLTPALEYQPAW